MLTVALATLGSLGLAGAAHAVEQKLVASDGSQGDGFGRSVAIDHNTAVIGAPAGGLSRGAVYVFTRSGINWTQSAKLTASDGAQGDRLGWSVAVDGDTIVAGAPGHAVGAGAVYTFERAGAEVRTETAKLTASDGAIAERLGTSVAIDGDTIVAGASGAQGSAYTFARTGTAERSEIAKLTASDGAVFDNLGRSVAIYGNEIVAGAPGDGTAAGSAYTFARTGGAERAETAKLTASDAMVSDRHAVGTSVAVDRDAIVAGAPGDEAGASGDLGSAYLFAPTGVAMRTSIAKLTASGGGLDDRLGESVAINGDAIVAGAPGNEAGTGVVYTFAPTGAAERTETAKLTAAEGAPGDRLGQSVAIDSGWIVAGAPFDDVGVNRNQGSASVLPAAPNVFGLGRVKRNKKRGTAKVTVGVPGQGLLQMTETKKVKAGMKRAHSSRKLRLHVKPRRKAKRKLKTKGKARVTASITFTPDGGQPNTERKRITLIKRR